MVIPTICKFVLFGPFYSKIGLDRSITVVRETKKNIHIHIASSTTLASIFTIENLCPVHFVIINNKQQQPRQIRACGKVYFKIISHPQKDIDNNVLANTYGYIIRVSTTGRWTLLCPGNYVISMPAMTYPYNM